jgi:hypothetical protein
MVYFTGFLYDPGEVLYLCVPPFSLLKLANIIFVFSLPHRDVVRINVFMEERNYIEF